MQEKLIHIHADPEIDPITRETLKFVRDNFSGPVRVEIREGSKCLTVDWGFDASECKSYVTNFSVNITSYRGKE